MALVGHGGTGKTELALKLAYDIKDKWPEYSIFWLRADTFPAFEQGCTEISQQLQVYRPGQEDVKLSIERELSRDERGKWLLIIDNADNYELVCGTQDSKGIVDYLPSTDVGLILWTTRSREVARAVAQDDVVEVGSMQERDALVLLQRCVPRDELLGDEVTRSELITELDYLPLAISQAGAYLSACEIPLREYLRRLKNTEQDPWRHGTELRDIYRSGSAENSVATT